MENFYSCTVKSKDTYKTVLISSDKIFPKQFNKHNTEQLTELKEMAFDKVIKDTMPFQICPKPHELELIYYKKLTKHDIEFAEETRKFEEEWFASEENDWY